MVNFAFGSASLTIWFGIFWLINGYVQGMGFPPCARLLTHWFPPHKLATKMSIWNISHQVGGSAITILGGDLVVKFGWRSCFYIPACIATIASIYLLVFLRDTPESLGFAAGRTTRRLSTSAVSPMATVANSVDRRDETVLEYARPLAK